MQKFLITILLVILQPFWNTDYANNTIIFPKKKEKRKYIVSATCYQPLKIQTGNDNNITASGFKIDTTNPAKHRIVAISRDLLKHFNFGDTIIVKNSKHYDGEWVIQDVMAKRWKRKIDFLVGNENYIARWKNVSIYKK